MSPRGFGACLALNARRMLRPLAAMLAAALAALLLGAVGAREAQGLLQGDGFEPLRIAVASRDDEYDVAGILAAHAPAAGLDSAVHFEFTTEEEARRRVAAGEAAAGILLPGGFGGSLLTGENLPPTLLVNAARPLERMLVASLAHSALELLTGAQRGVTATLEAVAPTDGAGGLARDLNLTYALWAVGRLDLFEAHTLNPTGALPIAQHYLLCVGLLLALLCAPVLYSAAPSAQNRGWLARLRSGGVSLTLYTLSGALCAWACYFILLLLLAGGLCLLPGGAGLSALARPNLWLALAACALFLACFALACCLLGSRLACSGAVCGLSLLMLYLAGGLLPPTLLPASVAALGRWTPFSWMLRALSPLFGVPSGAGPLLGALPLRRRPAGPCAGCAARRTAKNGRALRCGRSFCWA